MVPRNNNNSINTDWWMYWCVHLVSLLYFLLCSLWLLLYVRARSPFLSLCGFVVDVAAAALYPLVVAAALLLLLLLLLLLPRRLAFLCVDVWCLLLFAAVLLVFAAVAAADAATRLLLTNNTRGTHMRTFGDTSSAVLVHELDNTCTPPTQCCSPLVPFATDFGHDAEA